MSYKLRREVENGSVVGIFLGVPEVDAYLKFLKHGCRFNTWISYGYDLQIFLNSIQKPLTEVTPADILAFIESQRGAPNRQGRSEGISTKVCPIGRSSAGLPQSMVSTNISEFFMTYLLKIIRCREVW